MRRPARQVRTVRLRGPDAPSIRRGALLLEDALHTASLPDAAGGRLLVVRSLSCGPIRTGQSPASLALQIEQRMRQLSAGAIYAEETTAATATAVYFHDAVEPYIRLALRLARGQPLRAWFWPLAVPGWQPALAQDQALRLVLEGLAQTEPGPAAVARLVATLHQQAALAPLLAALRWQDGPALLRASGFGRWRPDPTDALDPDAASAPPAIEPGWWPLLQRWLVAWGPDDARMIWLALVALVAERPARLLDAALPRRGWQLIQQLQRPVMSPADSSTTPSDTAQPRAARPDAATSTIATAEAAGVALPTQSQTDEHAAGSTPSLSAPHAAEQPAAEHDGWAGVPLPSAYAGLFFALPALARLGLAALLEHSPALIELGLPELLLRALALRLGAPADDPALRTLTAGSALGRALRLDWIAPPLWRELAQPGRLLVRRVASAGRVLYDGSGLLPLALWHGRAPPELRALLVGQPLRRGAMLPPQPDLELLISAWLVALRRWCRRYAGLSLHQLVRRPGRILATPTHLDVLFDHRAADLRVRQAGLDIDPGWLPWFGRVVQFHYLYGEF